MNTKNLIPIHRLQLKGARRRIRQWVLINITYAGMLTIGCFAYINSTTRAADSLNLESIKAEVQKCNVTVASLRHQSMMLNSSLASNQALCDSPDWSILLTTLSNILGDEIALNRVDCIESAAGKAAELSPTAMPKVFRISGIGRSQKSVTQFVLNLEGVHFFDHVTFVQASPQTVAGYNAVAFDLVCDLNQRGK